MLASWAVREELCYDLNVECPGQTHVLDTQSLAGGANQESYRPFRGWSLSGGSVSLGEAGP